MAIGFDSRWASYNAANRITSYNSKLESSVGRITSGMRINSAADDPAGLITSEKMRDRIGALDQANINAQNDQAFVKTADSALGEVVDIYQRLKEIAVQASDGAISTADRAGLSVEAQALQGRLKDIKDNTVFGSQKIFNADDLDFYTGVDGSDDSKVSLAGSSLFAEDFSDIDISAVVDSAANAAGVLASDGDLATKFDKVLQAQSQIGGLTNAFGYINEGIENESVNLQSAHSTAFDTDVAREMTSYVKNSVLLQSSQLILSQQNNNAYSVLNLISN